MRRRSVGPETCIPSWGAKRSPNSPQVAKPSVWRASASRLVIRAYDCTRSGSRSVKIRRGQALVLQTNLRTVKASVTNRPPQGTSVCWLLGTSVHKIRELRQYNRSHLLSCLHEKTHRPGNSRTGKPMLNEYIPHTHI